MCGSHTEVFSQLPYSNPSFLSLAFSGRLEKRIVPNFSLKIPWKRGMQLISRPHITKLFCFWYDLKCFPSFKNHYAYCSYGNRPRFLMSFPWYSTTTRMNNNFLWVGFPCLCSNSKLDPSVLDYMQCTRSLQLYGVCCWITSPSLFWKRIGSSEMLQQQGKQLDDSHEQMSFRSDRKINSSHVIKHSQILRENQNLHKSMLLCVCIITAFKVLCAMGKLRYHCFIWVLYFT